MRRLLVYALGAVMLLLAGAAPAQNPPAAGAVDDPPQEARLRLEKEAAEVGERVDLVLTLPIAGEFEDVSFELPEEQRDAVYIGTKERDGSDRYRIEVRPLRGGTVTIGPAKVTVTPEGGGTPLDLSTGIVSLEVDAPPGEADPEAVKGYTDPLAVPFNYFWRNLLFLAGILLALFLLAALLLLAVWWLSRERRRRAETIEIVPPVVAALRRVRDLQSLDVYTHKGVEHHYTELSQALRRYIEDQYGHPAVEMTEDEIVELLRETLVDVPKTETLAELMRRSSMAKFARRQLDAETAREDCGTAEAFLIGEKSRFEVMRAEARAALRGEAPGDSGQEGRAA